MYFAQHMAIYTS